MRALVCLLAAAFAADGQSVCNSFHDLGDDIIVHSALYVDGPLVDATGFHDASIRLCKSELGPGFLRRILDVPQQRMFGYEVHVTRNPPGKKLFRVRVTPVQNSASTMYFPRGPEPVDVGESETIEFAIFTIHTREGSARLVERLQVMSRTGGLPALYRDPQAVVPARTPIALTKPALTRQDGNIRPVTSAGTVRGPNIWFYVPGLGRVWLSSVRQLGFESTVPIKGNQFEFRWDGVDYVVSTESPIIDLPGDWSVWMRLERDWKTPATWKYEDGLVMGARAI